MEVKGTVAVAQAIGRLSPELKPYVLKDVVEERKDIGDFRYGSDAVVIDLDLKGTKCVGKVLHPIFFEKGNAEAGMEKILEKFFREIKMLRKMSHPSIVKFLGIYYKEARYKEGPSLSIGLPVLVMEKMEYSLNQYLSTHEKGSISEEKALNILLDISKGLVYLHEEMKVAHRDLSSNNILLSADMSAKIADLGSARVLDRPGGWDLNAQLTVQPGTMDFMPPEALEDPPEYTVSVDVFSFGCVILHLYTHKLPKPIPVPKGEYISEVIRREKYISEMADSYLLPMVMQCLSESSEDRPASTDLLSLLQAKLEENGLDNTKEADYTVVFAGITGAGKSTAGNFFLNKEVFMSRGGVLRGSKDCMGSTSTICGKTVKIIDTPGFFDGFTATESNFQKLSKVVTLAKEGIHALAFVLGRYTDSCEEAIEQLLLFTGIQPFMFVLLTHAENLGENEVTTKEYIEECLSSPDCPTGFRDLMKMVENRVIMLETVKFIASDYREQKSKELIVMIDSLLETNENKIYSNSMLQLAAQVHEVAKQCQDAKIKEATEQITLYSEKIKKLKYQTDDTSSETNDEIVTLEEELEEVRSKCSKIENPRYLEEFTEKVLTDAMKDCENNSVDSENSHVDSENSHVDSKNSNADSKNSNADSKNSNADSKNSNADSKNSNADSKNSNADSKNSNADSKKFAKFAQSFAAYAAVSVAGTATSSGVYAGMGAIIGAAVGSFFPGLGTVAGAYAGAQILGVLGGTSAFGAITASFYQTMNMGKAREGVRGVIDRAKVITDRCNQM